MHILQTLCLAYSLIKINSRYSFTDQKITLHLLLSSTRFIYSLLCISICSLSVLDKIIFKRNTALILSWDKVQAFQYISPNQYILLCFHDHGTYLEIFILHRTRAIQTIPEYLPRFHIPTRGQPQNSIHFINCLKSV